MIEATCKVLNSIPFAIDMSQNYCQEDVDTKEHYMRHVGKKKS